MSPAKKPKGQVKSSWLKIRVTDDRLDRWREWAAKARSIEDDEDLDFSAWVRRALNRAMASEEAMNPASEERARRGKGGASR